MLYKYYIIRWLIPDIWDAFSPCDSWAMNILRLIRSNVVDED